MSINTFLFRWIRFSLRQQLWGPRPPQTFIENAFYWKLAPGYQWVKLHIERQVFFIKLLSQPGLLRLLLKGEWITLKHRLSICQSEYFPLNFSNFAILYELCNFSRILQEVAIWGQLCEIATSQNIKSPAQNSTDQTKLFLFSNSGVGGDSLTSTLSNIIEFRVNIF